MCRSCKSCIITYLSVYSTQQVTTGNNNSALQTTRCWNCPWFYFFSAESYGEVGEPVSWLSCVGSSKALRRVHINLMFVYVRSTEIQMCGPKPLDENYIIMTLIIFPYSQSFSCNSQNCCEPQRVRRKNNACIYLLLLLLIVARNSLWLLWS